MRRRTGWILLLLLLMALGLAAPPAWFWIETESWSGPAGSFPFPPEYPGLDLPVEYFVDGASERVRFLRWGESRGRPHGPYRCTDAEGRIRLEGQFARGAAIGVWSATDEDGYLLVRGTLDSFGAQHGLWLDTVETTPVEIIYKHGRIHRWRLSRGEDATHWIEPPVGRSVDWGQGDYRFLDAPPVPRLVGLGTWVQRPILTGEVWTPIGTWFCIRASGEIEQVGSMDGERHGLWTWFDEHGGIERQEHYDQGARQPELSRTAPPWYDLAACFEPSSPLEAMASEEDPIDGSAANADPTTQGSGGE